MPYRNGHYNVAPRYTPGSPALVDGDTARRVAREEKHFIEHALSGVWGEKQMERAKRLGLRGVAEYVVEKGSGKKHGWEVEDLCTGEKFFRLCSEALHKLGWSRFDDLPTYAKDMIDKDPPAIEDYQHKGWFKVEPELHAGFAAGWKVQVYCPEPLSS